MKAVWSAPGTTENAAARQAGVRHIVYVSIVGIDRVPYPYYRYKLMAEDVVRSGSVPWTILRGTQFHHFMDSLFRRFTRFPIGFLPKSWLCQPVHVEDRDVLGLLGGRGTRRRDRGLSALLRVRRSTRHAVLRGRST